MEFWFFVGPFTLPAFVLPITLPRRWLGPYLAVCALLFAYLLVDHRMNGGKGSGAGEFLGLLVFFMVIVGTIVGFLTRLACLGLQRIGRPKWQTYLPIAAGLTLLVVIPSLDPPFNRPFNSAFTFLFSR